jgi:lysozyme family protein
MKADFPAALAFTLKQEAGDYLGTDPDDKNVTRKGVTQATYSRWRQRKGLPDRSVLEATDDEIVSVYEEFWKDAHCDDLPTIVAIGCFDMAINGGPRRAIALFQKSAGFAGKPLEYSGDCDGIWGPKTAQAAYLARQDERRWGFRYHTARLAFYLDIADKPSEHNELRSWLRRLIHFNNVYLT